MFTLKNYDVPIDVIQYVILRFVSYFELDPILHCFWLTPKEMAIIKFKIYKQRIRVTKLPKCVEYRIDGKLHRYNGPAVEYTNGSKKWFIDGKRHRSNGPAIEWANGDKEWHIDNKLHRTDGPAIEWANGYKAWYIDGKRHRSNGPAVESANGYKAWYINCKKVPEFQKFTT